jgi:hypothetical protein
MPHEIQRMNRRAGFGARCAEGGEETLAIFIVEKNGSRRSPRFITW